LNRDGGRLHAFFLPADPGTRFALFHEHRTSARRGAFLYVHPFAEEMNKSRRMAALQARAFASAGFDVLQVDLHGSGDSSGDFGDARWDTWKRDVALAADWLSANSPGPLHLWGLRLGASLALECWRDAPQRYASAVLWHPVTQGDSFVAQFLRLALAGDVIRPSERVVGTETLRARLRAGEPVEIAGYDVSPALLESISRLRLGEWSLPGADVHWLDVRRSAAETPGAVQPTLDTWRARGVRVGYQAIAGDAFWSSFDIIEVPALVLATTNLYDPQSR
jgi:exosortase A-associated hydrolase 2